MTSVLNEATLQPSRLEPRVRRRAEGHPRPSGQIEVVVELPDWKKKKKPIVSPGVSPLSLTCRVMTTTRAGPPCSRHGQVTWVTSQVRWKQHLDDPGCECAICPHTHRSWPRETDSLEITL